MNWWEELEGPLLGRYRIERVLGEGGMARVFLATDIRSGRIVAIKSPKLESFPPDRVAELLKRFGREFESQIKDPIQGVVPIYDADEVIDAQGVHRPLLVMQYLTGGSLADKLGGQVGARTHQQTLGEVLAWLVPIARAIDALHRRKFLHRDIKPDNILFDGDDTPFLADFGVVGLLDSEHGMESTIGSSVTAMSPGSPGYMSPESITADIVARSAPASDQFSLGITVYEALSGRLPMVAGSAAEWFGALVHWSPTSLEAYWPERSPAAVAAVMKAISAKPHERFLSCSEFAIALDAAARKLAELEAERVRQEREHQEREEKDRLEKQAALDRAESGKKPWRLDRKVAVLLASIVVGIALTFVWISHRPDPEPLGGMGVVVTPAHVHSTEPAAVVDARDSPKPDLKLPRADEKQDKIETDKVAADRYVDAAANSGIFATSTSDKDKEAHDRYSFGISYYPEGAVVGEDGSSTLGVVVEIAGWNPKYRVEVASHSDSLEPDALGLTQRRAQAVAAYLVSHGVDASRIVSIEGKGATDPEASNETAHGRALNRRTIVTLHE